MGQNACGRARYGDHRALRHQEDLGCRDVPVVGVDKDVLSAGYFSRYCRSVARPDPEFDEDGYIRLLLELGEHMGGRPVLFP